MSLTVTDHYTVLGVARTADRRTIQAAYRALARRSHPDFGGDGSAMARINEAWRVLGDDARRAVYDGAGSGSAGGRATPEPSSRHRRDGRTILDFGRFAGWSLTEIARADDDYLAWLARTPLGRPLRAEIDEVLNERAAALGALRSPAAAGAGRAR